MDQILLVVQGLIALALVGTILMQRSEGGALGIGGGPGGMMSARGAGNFLTRATTILAALFLGMCILLAIRSGIGRDDSLMEGFDAESDPLAVEEQGTLPTIPDEDASILPPLPTVDVNSSEPQAVPPLGTDNIDPSASAAPPLPTEDGQ